MKLSDFIAVVQRTVTRSVQLFCFWFACLGLGHHSLLGAEVSREPQLKAAYIYNFAQFTQWPAEAFVTADSPIVIGVLASDLMADLLRQTVQGETIGGRKLVVQEYKSLRDLQTCHILFIPQTETASLEKAVAALKGKPILTVSDADRAAQRGAMIRLYPESNKLRLVVNMNALNAANLKVSSKVLRVATIVSGEGHP
jgi:YfiR/HmsC-like